MFRICSGTSLRKAPRPGAESFATWRRDLDADSLVARREGERPREPLFLSRRLGSWEIKNPANHSAGRVKKVLLVKLHLSPLPAGHFQPGNADIGNTLPRALRADGR